MRGLSARCLSVLGLAVVGCGGGEPTAGVGPTGALALAVSSGNEQIGRVGAALDAPLVVVVTEDGAPASGVAVSWSASGGALGSGTTNSGGGGVASNTLVLPAAGGVVTVNATLPGGSGAGVFRAYAVPAGAQVVDVRNNTFVPASVTIPAGGSVAWVWRESSRNHNIVPDASVPMTSGPLEASPRIYALTFSTPGTYRYFCQAHGSAGGAGMAGVVIVN